MLRPRNTSRGGVLLATLHGRSRSQMGKGEKHADGVDDCIGRDEQSLISGGEPSVVACVSEGSFDLPAVAIAAHAATVVGAVFCAVSQVFYLR